MRTAYASTNSWRVAAAICAALLARPALVSATPAYENDEPGARQVAFRAGDALQIGIPLAGLALTYLIDPSAPAAASSSLSWNGFSLPAPLSFQGTPRHDFFAAGLRMELLTESLKFGVNEQRPNGGSHSFPSGHTAAAFMGAEFIRKEYGWGWSVPAYLGASYVGWSRVASQNHYTRDVLAGALIGIWSNHDLGRISLPFGSMTVGPAMLETPVVNRLGGDESISALPTTGLQVRLEFGGR